MISKKKCYYCWFFRLEIEGIVERWQICNGNPSKWFEIQKQFEHVLSTDDDDEGEEEVA